MTVLKKGSRGTDVQLLQSVLRAHGYYGGAIDGLFGPQTDAAVRAFQRFAKITVDGIDGPETVLALGIAFDQAPGAGKDPKAPRSYTQVYSTFGDPLASGWSAANLVFCAVPDELKAFPTSKSNGGARGFQTHRLMAPIYQRAFREIVDRGHADLVKSYDGCWNVRKIRGSTTTMSLHSWGIAIDLNYVGNELGKTHPAMDPRLIAIFKANGFFWGGDYQGRKDGMHFEYFDRS